jgi:hypothetical protein
VLNFLAEISPSAGRASGAPIRPAYEPQHG